MFKYLALPFVTELTGGSLARWIGLQIF